MSPLHWLVIFFSFPRVAFLRKSSSVYATNHTDQRFSTKGSLPSGNTWEFWLWGEGRRCYWHLVCRGPGVLLNIPRLIPGSYHPPAKNHPAQNMSSVRVKKSCFKFKMSFLR